MKGALATGLAVAGKGVDAGVDRILSKVAVPTCARAMLSHKQKCLIGSVVQTNGHTRLQKSVSLACLEPDRVVGVEAPIKISIGSKGSKTRALLESKSRFSTTHLPT